METIGKRWISNRVLRRRINYTLHYLFATGFWSIVVAFVFHFSRSDLIPHYSMVTLALGFLLAIVVPLDFSQKRDQTAEGALPAAQSANGSNHSSVSSSDSDSGGDGGD
jgi:hypothetical protein